MKKLSKEKIGEVFKFFAKPSVAAIKVTGKIKIGDKLLFHGATTDFTMKLESMEIEGEQVTAVKKGQQVGLKVPERVRPGDEVYKV
ncbi:MAG: translation elongation factor-like protein [Candidatus Heimdallarchaeota archaeon]